MIDYILIGGRIKSARLSKGFTQEKLAELLAITPEYMSKIETGSAEVNLKRLSQLCLLLNCKLEYLITGTVVNMPDYASLEISELLQSCNQAKREAIIQIIKSISKL